MCMQLCSVPRRYPKGCRPRRQPIDSEEGGPQAGGKAHLLRHGHAAGQDVVRQQVRAAVHAAGAVVVALDLGACEGASPSRLDGRPLGNMG